jgi:hypothetical protein
MVVYSEPGLGKTTLGADMAKDTNGVFILGEDGLSALQLDDVTRTPVVESWEEFQSYLELFATEDHDHKSIIIDTIDAMAPLLYDYVVNKYYNGDTNKANAFKAYYTEQYSEFDRILKAFRVIQDRGINILVLAHSIIADHRSPDSENYKKFEIALPGGAKTDLATALTSYADLVLFGRKDIVVSEGKAKGGARVLMTECAPTYDAKSRKSIPTKIAMSWTVLKSYL